MKYQDFAIETTQKAADEAFRYAAAVPADKLVWKPVDAGRSVLDQAQELAKCPEWAYRIVSGANMADYTEEQRAADRDEMAAWDTIEKCKAECQARLDKLFELYRTVSDERLKETQWLPFDGGRDFTVSEMMWYPIWNFQYHTGQIAYVQTLYGDPKMY